jgi:DNA helicase HerA-like ATPase
VFDVGGFRRAEEKSLVANGLLGLLWHGRDQRQPCLVVIDEAHNICPQEPDEPIQAMATQRAIAIAAEGRKYGLYLLLSTQRPGKIHINILSQCDNLVLMRMNSADDLQRLAQVFSFVPSTLLDRSTTFAQGESLVAGKISPLPAIIRFGKRFSQEGGSDIPDTWTRPS